MRSLVLLLALFVWSCAHGGAHPDLIPLSLDDDLGPVGYCQRNSNGSFTVSVKNQGSADAPPSKVRIDFFPGGSMTLDLFGPGPGGALPAGFAWDLQFPDAPPDVCFDPDCEFRITVDSENDVDESNEQNNTAEGRCIG